MPVMVVVEMTHCHWGRLSAISRRRGLGETVADAIVGIDDREAIAALLGNTTSSIPEAAHGNDEKIQQASLAHLQALTNLVEN